MLRCLEEGLSFKGSADTVLYCIKPRASGDKKFKGILSHYQSYSKVQYSMLCVALCHGFTEVRMILVPQNLGMSCHSIIPSRMFCQYRNCLIPSKMEIDNR